MDDFDYELPRERIAQRPAARRDASRLLVVDRATRSWRDARFAEIGDYLRPHDLLVGNETAVFPARLRARGPGGAEVEILLVRPADRSEPEGVSGREWEALAGPARKARPGERLELLDHDG